MNTFKGLLGRWWFWAIAVIVLLPAAWFLSGYIPHKVRMWQVENYRDMAKAGYAEMQQEQEALEAAYRKDTYGGKTPEETLELFIEALEAKDYELAAKYFVVEEQQKALEENRLGEKEGANQYVVDTYRLGRIVSSTGVTSDMYTIEMYPAGESIPFAVRFTLNPYTQKWKIVEL